MANTLEMTNEGIALIKHYEPLSLTAYLSESNKWTIGYGHTQGVNEHDTCTNEEAERYFIEDCQRYDNFLNDAVGNLLNRYQRDALISFLFNFDEISLKYSALLKMIHKNPNSPKVGVELKRWVWISGKKFASLPERRKAEERLYFHA